MEIIDFSFLLIFPSVFGVQFFLFHEGERWLERYQKKEEGERNDFRWHTHWTFQNRVDYLF